MEEVLLANEIIEYVRSKECMQLNYQKLALLLELVIYNEKVIKILKKTPVYKIDIHSCFNIAYNKFINNEKEFILMSNINSFALSWLYLLYH